MIRFLGIMILWLGIALSVRFGVPEPLPKDQRIPKEIRDFSVPIKKVADKDGTVVLPETSSSRRLARLAKAKQNEIDIPAGMRALPILVAKNEDVEKERILPGTMVDLLIQDANDREGERWRILVENAVYLANSTCGGMGVESEEERREMDASSCVAVAVPLEEFASVIVAQAHYKVRLVRHTPEE